MRAFDLIFAMTQGGPLDASNVLPLLSYQFSFQQFQFGIGAAIGTFAFVIVFGVALLYVRTLKQGGASDERGSGSSARCRSSGLAVTADRRARRRALPVPDLLDVRSPA